MNYKQDLTGLENQIAKRTLHDNPEAVQLLLANLNTVYGMMLAREGAQPDVFPVNSPERAVKFMVGVYGMGAFQFGSSIMDHMLNGRYPEASALLRSLIELVGFSEYFMLSPDIAYSSVREISALPSRTAVFRKLSKEGRWPVGGPKKSFERYNHPAHAHIAYLLQHTAEAEDGPPSVTRIWLRRFNQESFHRLARHTLMPLFGLEEVYLRVFFDKPPESETGEWTSYWRVGHDRSVIARVFPSMNIGTRGTPTDDAA